MSEKSHLEHLTDAVNAGRISRRAWIKAMLVAGVAMPALVKAMGPALAQDTKDLRVFMVPKFTGFVFFELARDGAEKACKELGCELTYVGTTTADVEGQVQVYQNLVPQRPDVLVTAALDINAGVPALRRLRQQGTVVVTFDADVAPQGRDLFVNMAPFDVQARAMLESALANVPEGGKAIWVAPTPTVANFISQKKALDDLIASEERYASIEFIDTLYAEDDPEKSYQVGSSAMQAHPDLKLFISGSGISVPALNKAIEDTGRRGEVYATGYGLPDTMTTYIANDTIKQYALWSPFDFGYMATYAGVLIKAGELAPEEGTTFDVPNLGERSIDDNRTANLNAMLFFTKGHDTFETGIPMKLPQDG
ncbi:MAG: autoinducer 2 ABC transporter substrate-binding protein [Devosia sp.]